MKNERMTVIYLVLIALCIGISKVDAQEMTYVCPPCNSSCDNLTFSEAGICSHCNMALITLDERRKMEEKKTSIAFYLQDGVEVLDFAGPMEVFVYAGFEVFTVSKNRNPITSQGVLKILPDYDIIDAPSASILAFFGGNSTAAFENRKVIEWVKSQQHVEQYFSVCTGAFVLAEAGILDGKTATTFHNALDGLEKNYPSIKVLRDVRYVDNGKVITTAGISAGIDGALHMVAKLKGFREARRAAYHMEYDKWIPGEGLMLTENDPYKGIPSLGSLEKFEGIYEHASEENIEVFTNMRERTLWARVTEQNYPLFFDGDNQFTQLDGDSINFQEENDQVVGFTSSHSNLIYTKIK